MTASCCASKRRRACRPSAGRARPSDLERRLRAAIGATAEVTMLPFDTLPRTEGKTRLVERTSS